MRSDHDDDDDGDDDDDDTRYTIHDTRYTRDDTDVTHTHTHKDGGYQEDTMIIKLAVLFFG